ncbi:MAG: repeat protein [Acidobacteriaceae bacterium]|nr:repeat protein [Acidobacteriaceae bacterium]
MKHGFAAGVPGYNREMRWACGVVVSLLVSALLSAQTHAPLLPCPEGASESQCNPSKKEIKQARAAFSRGMKLQGGAPDAAFEEFSRAAELVPRNVEYMTTREVARQQLVYNHIQRGNSELQAGKQAEALADFRAAVNLDPSNRFAQERMRDALGDSAPKPPALPTVVDESPEIQVAPSKTLASFHFRGESKELLTTIARSYQVSAQIEDSVQSRRVFFNIDNVDFFKAMMAAGAVTKTFWSPLGEKQILVAADTPENRRQYERMAMRTFYIPGVDTPAVMTDIVNLLRNLLEIRFITPNAASATIVVRAPQAVLDAATQLLRSLDTSRPEVMLDVHVYQVSHTFARNIGVHIPNDFNLFNIPAGALAALGGQNIQSLINQLISSGGINQANNTAISALLAQLQSQQSSSSIFSQPLATFGGGKTLTGVSLDHLSAELSLNEGWVKTLDQATLRASQGNDATFRMGSRYPILNASFAPVFNSAAISQVLQNNSFQAAFPSFNYEDLGLTVKAKTAITSDTNVNLQLEINLRALAGQSVNGVPIIGNREYKGSINLQNGEPAVVAGQVSRSETRDLSGIPGLSQIPGLGKLTGTNSKQVQDDELLVVITPHITRRAMGQATEVYLPK